MVLGEGAAVCEGRRKTQEGELWGVASRFFCVNVYNSYVGTIGYLFQNWLAKGTSHSTQQLQLLSILQHPHKISLQQIKTTSTHNF